MTVTAESLIMVVRILHLSLPDWAVSQVVPSSTSFLTAVLNGQIGSTAIDGYTGTGNHLFNLSPLTVIA
jgi:hypothetical protein